MPSRFLSCQSEGHVLEKAFNENSKVAEWDDWTLLEGGVKPGCSICSLDTWITDIQSTGRDTISTPFITQSETCLEDILLELDDTIFPTLQEREVPTQDLRRPSYETSSLTQVGERYLQDSIMPPYRENTKIIMPSIPASECLSSSQPIHSSRSSRLVSRDTKRIKTAGEKSKDEEKEEEEKKKAATTCQRRRGHNAIEKRYRTNLNDKISCLREAIPPFKKGARKESTAGEEHEDSAGEFSRPGQKKSGKADVLVRALDYIKHLENTTQRLEGEVIALGTRIESFERLATNGSLSRSGKVGKESEEKQLGRRKADETP